MKLPIHVSFKTRLIMMICLFNIAAILSLSYFNYKRYTEQLTNNTINQTQQIIEQAGSNIETYLDELYRLTLAPYYNDYILGILSSQPSDIDVQLTQKRKMDDFLSSTMILPRDEILRVYLMNEWQIYSYTRTPYEMPDYDSYLTSDWYQQALESTHAVYIPPHLEKAFGDKKTPVFSIVRSLRSKEDNNKLIGVIKVDADYTGIKKICDRVDLKNDSALFVLNNENQIIYQTNSLSDNLTWDEFVNALENSNTLIEDSSGKKYILNHYSMDSSGLKILALSSYQELMEPIINNLKKTVLLAFVVILFTIGFFLVFVKRFLSPLSEIISQMKKVEQGHLEIEIIPRKQDEIGFLAISFNKMLEKLRQFIARNTQLVKEVYEAKYLYKESQYNALCSQIKPHFMYNTLNLISLLIKCNENTKAIRAIESFSHYLGGIMNVDREIPLENEIQICKAYLSIIQLRYEDRLTYHIQIDSDLNHFKIPSLSIQTIVENAVKYGCEPNRDSTEILIASEIDEAKRQCRIIVRDNGMGMDSETLENITARISEIRSGNEVNTGQLSGKIGLTNVCKRLFLKFENNADMIIQSDYVNGTTVTICLPMPAENSEVKTLV